MFGWLKRMCDHADRINDYFVAATTAYVFKGDEAAGFAAYAAGVVAAKKQRQSMIWFLTQTSAWFKTNPINKDPEGMTLCKTAEEKLHTLSLAAYRRT